MNFSPYHNYGILLVTQLYLFILCSWEGGCYICCTGRLWWVCKFMSFLLRYRDSKVCGVLMHLFGVVQAHRTSSNLLEPHHYKDSNVCRVLSHEFWVVRPYRTFSVYIVTGVVQAHRTSSNLPERTSTVPNLLYLHRYRGNKVCRVLCTCSGWLKHIEPPRTFLKNIITKIARFVEFCHMSSGWFDCTEPSLSTSLQR